MRSAGEHGLRALRNFTAGFEVTAGSGLVVFTSVVLFVVAGCLGVPAPSLSVGSSLHVHQLFSYTFTHNTAGHLAVSAGVLLAFSGGLEKGVGTVRFLCLLLLFSFSTGLLFTCLQLLVVSPGSRGEVAGLIPAALSVLGTVTTGSRMKKAFILGVSVPTVIFPWVILLAVTLFVPGSVLLCNVIAVIVGVTHGKGLLSFFHMSESRASVLEKKMPFRLMRRVVCVCFVPASAEERRKVLHVQCNPAPGSYPVQAYGPALSAGSLQPTHSRACTHEGWPQSYMQQSHLSPMSSHGQYHPYGHSHNHYNQHGFSQGYPATSQPWMPVGSHVPPTSAVGTAGPPSGTLPHLSTLLSDLSLTVQSQEAPGAPGPGQ
ncbi:rhomboid domain-containing protein 2 isoform X1 [Denticeps clupeoides]|uniref:rhomboid domain-containing protein 2 isoform X1 n=1 Tax=Denticeps clupeoides TaxID=299321 RepID=UPI0010A36052|nr:rhomboid domain-containing protein 2 isoform X1 [Denticeps clupeoides]